jgi:adenylate kinase
VRVILIAPPGAGKGTQGKRIAARYGVPHISSGDLFRQEVARRSPVGEKVCGYLDAGELVPDDLVVSVVEDRILAAARECGGFVLDGFPRTVPQAEAAAKIAAAVGIEAQAVLLLDAPADVLTARLLAGARGRSDDNEATVRRRLEVYAGNTQPLIDYFAGRGLLHRVDAAPPVDDVSAAIFAVLDPLA